MTTLDNQDTIVTTIAGPGDKTALDTSTAGIYTYTYTVTDLAGNVDDTVTRSVTVVAPPDTTAPVISLTGDATVTLTVGDTYTDAGATAEGYAVSVDNDVASVTLTPTTANDAASVTVAGTAVASGKASEPIDLAVGANDIATLVTAQDGTEKTYTVTVTRAAAATIEPTTPDDEEKAAEVILSGVVRMIAYQSIDAIAGRVERARTTKWYWFQLRRTANVVGWQW